ncbi:5401_t:CDS:10 [Entrophospora sp. SA101]|nr:5401_t:CDS:10 [Entrophospora sp. SA101]
MVSIDKLTREELTTIIAKELNIDVAFPCFSVEEQTSATVCCVVHKHWLSILEQARLGETTQLKRYTYTRSTLNSQPSDHNNDDRQSLTTNVLVSVFLKRHSPADRRSQIFIQKNVVSNHEIDESIIPLRTFLKEQLDGKSTLSLAEIEARYNNYYPLFSNDPSNNTDQNYTITQKAFVEKFIKLLYPKSSYFQILPQSDNPGTLTVKLISKYKNNQNEISRASAPNLIDIFAVLESENAFYFMAPYRGTTLHDLLNYSYGVLNSNVKKSFIVYQLLRTIQNLHRKGIIHGGLKPSNILVDDNLWIKLTGFECSIPIDNNILETKNAIMEMKIPKGRRIGDPNFHPILPWITDFKGSKVTKYEPNEYLPSMKRLFEWTPDECIPEFYTDPSIFTSIHPDMPDLQLPSWASSPDEFIRIHSEALESDYVSSQLHHWIDLTFGCKLSGDNAVKEKNVALPLLDGQGSFIKHGITQLFSDPHPQKSNKIARLLNNGGKIGFEDYRLISPMKRIPSKLTHSSDKLNQQQLQYLQKHQQQQVDLMADSFINSDKTVGKYQTVSAKSKSPKLRPVTATRSHSLYDVINHDISKDNTLSPLATPNDFKDVQSRIDTLVAIINKLPIKFLDELNDNYFIETLDSFEKAHFFSTKYIENKPIINNKDVLIDGGFCGDDNDGLKDSFAYGRAWDAYCLGQIMESIYASPKNTLTSSLDSHSLNATNNENGESNQSKLPLSVQETISSLLSPNWRERPTIDAIIYSSVPAIGLYEKETLPLPECIPEVYEFLTDFHKVDWVGRLKLAEHWMNKLCNLVDEAFYMILPSLILLFTHDDIKFEALSIFPKLGQRLGQDEVKSHLLKPILSLFESSRPSIPKILFESTIIEEFIHRFGITNFLQQLLPLYLEALTIEEKVLLSPSSGSNNSFHLDLAKQKILTEVDYVSSPVSIPTANKDISSLDNAIPSVAQLANSALVEICTLIGPILTSKNVMRQVYKMFLKESSTLPFLMQSIFAIGNQFGETFAHLQVTQVINIIQQYGLNTINNGNYSIICNNLSLLGKLITSISSNKILLEFESGFSETLKKLLIQILEKKLSISSKVIEFLLHVSNNITQPEWEKHIAPIIQKYFELFDKNLPVNNIDENIMSNLDGAKKEQMVYAYSQFCSLFDQGMMRRIVSLSEAIENYDNHDVVESLTPILLANSPSSVTDTLAISDHASITSGSSTEKNIHIKNNSKWGVSFEDKRQLSLSLLNASSVLSTNEVTATIFTPSSSSSNFSGANKTLSLFTDGASKKLLDINNNVISGGNFFDRSMRSISNGPVKSNTLGSSSPIVAPKKSKLKDIFSRTKNSSFEDLKNWNRFLSTNSEEMSNSMQFMFNDLKLRTFQGHTLAVRSIDVNEHSRYIVSGSRDRTVKLWSLNIHNGIENLNNEPFSECLINYTGHKKSSISDVHFLSGGVNWGLGDVIASCDGHIHVWDPESGKTLYQNANHKTPYLTFKPIFKSKCLVIGLSDSSIGFLNVKTNKILHSWKSVPTFAGMIKVICVNPSETLIAIGFSSGVISLLESRTGTLVENWKAGDSEIVHLKFYANNYLISYTQSDNVICIWEIDSICLVKTIKGIYHLSYLLLID